MGMKKAKISNFFSKPTSYDCKFPWPDDCFCQAGGDGIVLPRGSLEKALHTTEGALETIAAVARAIPPPGKSYRTAFFEAFPENPDTFIRGEGKTIEEAEGSAWKKFERIAKCAGHEYERRGYANGAGFCKHCGLFVSHCFPSNQRTDEYPGDLEVMLECDKHGDDEQLKKWLTQFRGDPASKLTELLEALKAKNGGKDDDDHLFFAKYTPLLCDIATLKTMKCVFDCYARIYPGVEDDRWFFYRQMFNRACEGEETTPHLLCDALFKHLGIEPLKLKKIRYTAPKEQW